MGDRGATARFLARLGMEREQFVHDHFGEAWGWYERLTVLCTAGQVRRWRERCVRACRVGPGDRVLDVGTGTGPLLLRATRRLGDRGLAVGLDISGEGLVALRGASLDGGASVRCVRGRAVPLPFRNGSFDCVLVGFALRHFGAAAEVLPEFRRVLVPGGRLGIVDFLRPRPGPLSSAGLAYLFWMVPLVSLILSRRLAVYRLARYLPRTIVDAPGPRDLGDEMREAGFHVEEQRSLCAGIVWLFAARAITPRTEPRTVTTVREGEGVGAPNRGKEPSP